MNNQAERVLIFRVGSLGDTLIALPLFRLVARAFPSSERRLLTYEWQEGKAARPASILEGMGLVHGFIDYGNEDRRIHGWLKLTRRVRHWRPDVLIYMASPKGMRLVVRDAIFFYGACAIRNVIGLPVSRSRSRLRELQEGRVERESSRLARCLAELGDARLEDRNAWDLGLSRRERMVAGRALAALPSGAPIVAASVGARVDVKDWGDRNWGELIERLSGRLAGWSLVMIGAASERARTQRIIERWKGYSLNLSGEIRPRESAAVLERASLYIGHDSGPMHLAAAVGTRSVAVFSARSKPGQWFPAGMGHRVIYHQVPCLGCGLAVCVKHGKKCILSIGVDEVLSAVEDALSDDCALPSP